MVFHQNTFASKADAFHHQAHTLLVRHIAFQTNLSSGADDTLPGEGIARFAQHLNHLPVIEGVARSRCDLRIGCYLPFWNLPHRPSDGGVAVG